MINSKILNEIIKDIRNAFKIRNKKRFVLENLPYLLFFYIGNIFASHINSYVGRDIIDRILVAFSQIDTSKYIPSLKIKNLVPGLILSVVTKLILIQKKKKAKKFREGREYGSARWGSEKGIEPYIDKEFENNVLLTQTERLIMNNRSRNPKYVRNKNVLVIRGSGSSRTRFFVKPNLMQMCSSYVVTDPKGTLVSGCGKMLERDGYEIKMLNTTSFKKSMRYNPFVYLKDEKDILKLVQTTIVDTKGEGEKSTEDFWVKAEKLYYTALIGYIWYEAPKEEQNFTALLDVVDTSEVRGEDENFKNAVDYMFEALEKEKPNHFAIKQYKKYKLAAGVIELRKTLNHRFSEICTS